MADPNYRFELPKNIEPYLAALSKHYGQEGERQLQAIIVNAKIRIHEEWSFDNWDGGTYGHALYLTLPDVIYLPLARQKHEFEERIRADLEKIHNVQNEFIEKIFLEMALQDGADWRLQSGALLQATRHVPDDAENRIWAKNRFRLFLSHKSEVKKETAELKDKLSAYGISCFVAHTDIHPTKEWQDEIENALATMEGFAALMTENFHTSDWTDQEVGYAFARGVPIIPVRLGLTPYGFIGKFQALSCTWATAAEGIVKLLVNQDRMFAAYVSVLKECPSFDRGNTLAAILPAIQNPSDHQLDALVEAYDSNPELQGAYGFNGSRPTTYGHGLLHYLNNWSNRHYFTDHEGKITCF